MYSLNCRGQLLDLSEPVVMGILNTTPDSFHAESRLKNVDDALFLAEAMVKQGAAILDIGGASTRPGAAVVTEDDELKRVLPVLEAIRQTFPGILLSIDTWRSRVAEKAIEAGVQLINDISAGTMDAALWDTPGIGQCPYILMHMQGTPQTMQKNPVYEDVVQEVLDFFIEKTAELHQRGIYDIVLDPGFGFGKTVEQNYTLLRNMAVFERVLQRPVLAGISRKSMICRVLNVPPSEALNGTTALHMAALERGARLLRAHDVKEAVETVRLWQQMRQFR